MSESSIALAAILLWIVASTRWLEARLGFVKKITSAVVCTLSGMLLANIGVIPHRAPLYQEVFDIAVPYAIVLVVIGSSLSELRRAGPRLAGAFALAGIGTALGGLVGGLVFASRIGGESWKLAGQFVGAFFGGGMNYAAIGSELETSPELFAAGAVAINLSTVPWLLTQMTLAGVLARYFAAPELQPAPSPNPSPETTRPAHNPRLEWVQAELRIEDVAVLGCIPLAVLWASRWLSESISTAVPEILWITTLSLILAQLPWISRLRGAVFLSYFAMHLFFVVIGAQSVFADVLKAGPSVLLFMLTVLLVHAVVLFGLGKLTGLDIRTISVASQAAVGGPGSALALTMSLHWNRLVTPGIVIGIFGYALGNYLGIGCAFVLRALG